jgi:hypothetical protein
MFSPALSAIWLMFGYLILLILLGVFTASMGRMKGIKTRAGYLGAIFWMIGVIFYFILAQIGSPDAIILIVVSFVVPLFYLINLLALFLNKKQNWVDAEYKAKCLRYLLIFLAVLAIYITGLIIA